MLVILAAVAAVSVTLGLVAWNEERQRRAAFIPPEPPPQPLSFRFQDITRAAGIRFVANSGGFGAKWFPETVGAGAAFLDFDGDGWQDIFLVNGRNWTPQERDAYKNGTGREHARKHKFVIPPLGPKRRTTCALLRNNRDGTFSDVTKGSGLDIEMYGEGVAVGDYNNDGKVDLYVTAIGRNYLFRNMGAHTGPPMSTHAATNDRNKAPSIKAPSIKVLKKPSAAKPFFREEAQPMGVRDGGWSSSAAWVDYDRDGLLDLFVCHYVLWTPQNDVWYSGSDDPDIKRYAAPTDYKPDFCRLYHNDGVRFREVSQRAGIAPALTPASFNATRREPASSAASANAASANAANADVADPGDSGTSKGMAQGDVSRRRESDALRGKSLGVVILDVDADSWPDIAVTNDTTPNFLFRNNKNGTFSQIAARVGIAMGPGKRARAGMGVDAGDFDGQNRDSLVIGNFDQENLGIYQNQGGVFRDFSSNTPVADASKLFVQFGCVFADFDLDSRLDIMTANGHITGSALGAVQRPLLFHNVAPAPAPTAASNAAPRQTAHAVFEEVALLAGEALSKEVVGRGLATADIDLDGDLDVLITTNGGAPLLLRNDGGNLNNSVRITLQGTKSNRSAIGAVIEATIITSSGKQTLRRTVKSGSSYLSQSELPLAIGLGKAVQIDSLIVRWPSGRVSKMENIKANQNVVIDEERGLVRRQALNRK